MSLKSDLIVSLPLLLQGVIAVFIFEKADLFPESLYCLCPNLAICSHLIKFYAVFSLVRAVFTAVDFYNLVIVRITHCFTHFK